MTYRTSPLRAHLEAEQMAGDRRTIDYVARRAAVLDVMSMEEIREAAQRVAKAVRPSQAPTRGRVAGAAEREIYDALARRSNG